jgi:uncharacterized protein YqfB (UPF0267 family)
VDWSSNSLFQGNDQLSINNASNSLFQGNDQLSINNASNSLFQGNDQLSINNAEAFVFWYKKKVDFRRASHSFFYWNDVMSTSRVEDCVVLQNNKIKQYQDWDSYNPLEAIRTIFVANERIADDLGSDGVVTDCLMVDNDVGLSTNGGAVVYNTTFFGNKHSIQYRWDDKYGAATFERINILASRSCSVKWTSPKVKKISLRRVLGHA